MLQEFTIDLTVLWSGSWYVPSVIHIAVSLPLPGYVYGHNSTHSLLSVIVLQHIINSSLKFDFTDLSGGSLVTVEGSLSAARPIIHVSKFCMKATLYKFLCSLLFQSPPPCLDSLTIYGHCSIKCATLRDIYRLRSTPDWGEKMTGYYA